MKKQLYIILFCLGTAIRFFHLGEAIESPHTWRQSDTANYIWDFYTNGINLFSPSVCWMGDHKTLLLEFPITEAIIATTYHITGPSHVIAKIWFLLFFLGSCFYFFKIINHFFNLDITRLITLVYLFSPLSQFYSRAIHIDYTELFFIFAMAYYYTKGINRKSNFHLTISAVFATLALVTKAPYAITFSIPLIAYTIQQKKLLLILRKSYIFIIPIIVFILWQNFVFRTNDSVPDWNFIPGFRKFTYNPGWYYGAFSQRLNLDNWQIITSRIFNEVLGYSGLALVIIGLFFSQQKKTFFYFWLVATICYLLLFFNLNRVHNYYQIPFVPILSIFMGLGIHKLSELTNNLKLKPLFLLIPLLIYSTESTIYSEKNYYKIQHLHLEIGETIRSKTKPSDLVIINFENYDSKCPNFLYAAKRNGWQIPNWGLKGNVLYRLMLEKANYFATTSKVPPSGELEQFLNSFPLQKIELRDGHQLFLYELKFKYIWEIMPQKIKNEIKTKGLL